MEENNNQVENNTLEENKNICHTNHCWKKCLALICAAFLGGFLAVYFVTDQMAERAIKRHHPVAFNHERLDHKIYKDMDKMYKNDMKAFDEAFKKFDKNFEKHAAKLPKFKHDDFNMPPVFMMDSVKIKTEFDDDKFNVIIGLKPFDNDERKINYSVSGRKLRVFGKSEARDKDYVQDIEFSQDFILPENADIANISKIKDDKELIISVPLKN